MKKYEEEMALFKKNNPEEEKVNKVKVKSSKKDQEKNNNKDCNCGNCDECKKRNNEVDNE